MRDRLPPLFQPRRGKPLAVAALFDELPLQPADLAVEQIVGLVNQTDHRVGNYRRLAVFEPPGVVHFMVRHIGLIRPISLIRLIRPISSYPHIAHQPRLWGVLLPLLQLPLAQKVFVVEQQLIEARAGNVYEPQLGLTSKSPTPGYPRRCSDARCAPPGPSDHAFATAYR